MMLQVNGLSASYISGNQNLSVISDVSLSLGSGEMVGIVGPSGCGKTTLLLTLAGLLDSYHGSISFSPPPGSERLPLFLMFQYNTLFPWLSVLGNVIFGLHHFSQDPAYRRRKALEMIHAVGLSQFADAKPSELSGGMNQRASLARALVLSPSLLMMDEPFGALDSFSKAELHTLLLDSWTRDNFGCLFVTHDLDEAVTLADRVLIMSARPGSIREEFIITLPRPRVKDGIRSSGYEEVRNRLAQKVSEISGLSVIESKAHTFLGGTGA